MSGALSPKGEEEGDEGLGAKVFNVVAQLTTQTDCTATYRAQEDALCKSIKHITDDPLEEIFRILTLSELSCYSKVCVRWRKVIVSLMPRLQVVDLSQKWVSLGGSDTSMFRDYVSRFKSCKVFSVSYCNKATDEVLAQIFTQLWEVNHDEKGAGRLQELNLFFCHLITDKTVALIVKLFPHLERLNLGRCPLIDDDGIRMLGHLKHLVYLSVVCHKKLSDDVIQDFETWPSLLTVDVTSCKFSPDGIAQIADIKQQIKDGTYERPNGTASPLNFIGPDHQMRAPKRKNV